MQININCVRDILLQIEDCPPNERISIGELYNALDYSKDEIIYHCYQLYEANLITITKINNKSDKIHEYTFRFIRDLTPEGHKLVETLRPQLLWDKIKNIGSKYGQDTMIALFSYVREEGFKLLVSLLTP